MLTALFGKERWWVIPVSWSRATETGCREVAAASSGAQLRWLAVRDRVPGVSSLSSFALLVCRGPSLPLIVTTGRLTLPSLCE